LLEKKTPTIKSTPEKAVIIGTFRNRQEEEVNREYLDELEFLAETAGATVAKRFTQRQDMPHPKTYLGTGKLDEVQDFVKSQEIDLVIFDDELSPSQLKNIEHLLDAKVMDRTNLILDIFAGRARSSHARTQVELAQYQYLLPRLSKMWTHLQKQKGGIGMKGPGEREIETDRRIIRDRISKLKTDLEKIDRQMATQRGNRGQLVRVALVGYTNVGKSTLMNVLSKADVFAENKLFATLDTTVRKVVVGNLPFLLTDTVGFIRKLPTQLVESFKSTLDEVREADLLVHVVDISHPAFEDHFNSVMQTVSELGASETPTLVVFNKIDAFKPEERDPFDLEVEEKGYANLEELRNSWMARTHNNAVFISAQKKINLEELRNTLYYMVKGISDERYPNLAF
jgi:GTP-binding protein HflX